MDGVGERQEPEAAPLRLPSLQVRGLRNVDQAGLDLAPGLNLLVGGNGQGKTTLLEAAYLLGAVRSFRGARSDDLVQHGAACAEVRGSVCGREPSCEVVVVLERRLPREVRVEGKRAELSLHFHRFPMVAFHPGDLDLVLGSPEDRRRFLDRMLFQARAGYAVWHREYRRALRSRNELLRAEAPAPQVRAFDGVLASRGSAMAAARAELCGRLAAVASDVQAELGVPAFEVRLSARVEPTEGALLAALERSLPSDRARRSTTMGPHTDDLVLSRPEGRAQRVASRGEARALAVSLRLAERRVVASASGSLPLLLLDDVAAELDRDRTARVVSMVTRQGGQVLVTATGAAEEQFGSGWRRFEIRQGVVAAVRDS